MIFEAEEIVSGRRTIVIGVSDQPVPYIKRILLLLPKFLSTEV